MMFINTTHEYLKETTESVNALITELEMTKNYIPMNFTGMVDFMKTTTEYLLGNSESMTALVTVQHMTRTYKPIDAIDILFLTMGFIGIIDNGVVLVVILSSKMMRSNITNLFIINQSCIDLMTSIFLVINYPAYIYIAAEELLGTYGDILCKLWMNQIFLWSLFMASCYNLIVITVERYMEIVHPLFHKTHFNRTKAYMGMALSWFIGFFYKFTYIIPTSGVINNIPVCIVAAIYPNIASQRFVGVFSFFVEYALPMSVMIYCYTKMAISLKMRIGPDTGINIEVSEGKRQRHNKMTKYKKNILKTLIVVANCYFLCWTWSQMSFLFFNVGMDIALFTPIYYIGVTLAFFNTCINPIIYTVRYKQFQQAFRRLVCGKKLSHNEVTSSYVKSSTHA